MQNEELSQREATLMGELAKALHEDWTADNTRAAHLITLMSSAHSPVMAADGTCPRCGGTWGDDLTCEYCCDEDEQPIPASMPTVQSVWVVLDNRCRDGACVDVYATAAIAYQSLAQTARDGGLPDDLLRETQTDQEVADRFLEFWSDEDEVTMQKIAVIDRL